LKESHKELCYLAHRYRSLNWFDSLPQRQSAASSPPVLSDLRHYIGRLGSWSRAAKILVRVAMTHPNFICEFKVEYLVSPPPSAPPAPDSKTNLESALGRMIPAEEGARLRQVQETLRDIRHFDVSESFYAAYTDVNFKPRVHAELQLLEHFYCNDLEFENNDRYIGCSKPSCYCCDLYMKLHPGNFVERPCHGNLWTSWQAPAPPIKDTAEARKHTAKILNGMAAKIRKDVLFQIDSRQPRRRRVPDSTTGLSTEVAGLTLGTGNRPNIVSSSYTSMVAAD